MGVNRLVVATGWNSDPKEVDWTAAEASLGTPLPGDFKELGRRFSDSGAFNDFVQLSDAGTGPDSLSGYHARMIRYQRNHPDDRSVCHPYRLFGEGEGGVEPGLLQWGYSELEDQYYWLVDLQTEPAEWPVVAREDPLEPFHRLDMSASEFIYRVLTDRGFRPFTVAHKIQRPRFEAYGGGM